jgi:hypothetical protein
MLHSVALRGERAMSLAASGRLVTSPWSRHTQLVKELTDEALTELVDPTLEGLAQQASLI